MVVVPMQRLRIINVNDTSMTETVEREYSDEEVEVCKSGWTLALRDCNKRFSCSKISSFRVTSGLQGGTLFPLLSLHLFIFLFAQHSPTPTSKKFLLFMRVVCESILLCTSVGHLTRTVDRRFVTVCTHPP